MKERTDTKQLRSFGLMVGGIFAIVGAWPFVVAQPPRGWAIVLGVGLIFLGGVLPRSLALPFKWWMLVGHVLGWINTRIILSVVFYLIITPMGLVIRLLGKTSIRASFDPSRDTYRVLKTARPSSHLKHQF